EMDSAAKVRVQQALEHGGVKHVMNCMWENLDSESITWRGARAIRDQFMNSDEIRQLCVDNKGEEILIAGLTAFPQSNTVQSHCLRALAALVFGNDVIRRHCGEKGCMRRVAIAMQNHSADGSVVIHACTALTNLAHNNADNRARYLEANGVQVLLTAMEAHFASSPKIQRQACWALLTLAGSDDASRSIVAAGGAEKIKKAMIIHKYDKGVQQFGCWAISNLALAGDDIRLLIRGTGIVEVHCCRAHSISSCYANYQMI
ncbi:aarA, partial [Symbiodinium microadriaticum]